MRLRERLGLSQAEAFFMESFGLSRAASLATVLLIGAVIVLAVFWFFHSAPPDTITMTSGPPGSIFQGIAERYRDILARNGVRLRILTSEGSRENLLRLVDASSHVEIGFVQGGVAEGIAISRVVSLGSIFYVPLLVFVRDGKDIELLSQLKGRRLAIGPIGSGTRSLASALLALNGVVPGDGTDLENLEAEQAAKALTDNRVDAVFLMGDVASIPILRGLLFTPSVHLLDFAQADAYTRRVTYLSRLTLPRGSVDFGKDVPGRDIALIGPTVELIACPTLHPALSDLLLEAAEEINGKAGLFSRQGEFPAPLQHEYRISSDAQRFYRSGRTFLYRSLPFWLASLVNRTLIALVPLIVILVPLLRIAPGLFQWRMRLRLYRWYRVLLLIEKDVMADGRAERRSELLDRLDSVEKQVNKMKVPASFGDQFYVLREHIRFVHNRLADTGHSH